MTKISTEGIMAHTVQKIVMVVSNRKCVLGHTQIYAHEASRDDSWPRR